MTIENELLVKAIIKEEVANILKEAEEGFSKETMDKIKDYIEKVHKETEKEFKQHYPSLKVPNYEIKMGKKFAKIIRKDNQTSVFCFIDSKGNIYKAAGWNAPAKGIRGNVFNDDKLPLTAGSLYR